MLNKRLLKESFVKRTYIPLNFIKSILNSLFLIFNALLLSKVINAVFIEKKGINNIINFLILFVFNGAVKYILDLILNVKIKNDSEDIKEEIRRKTCRMILETNPYVLKKQKLGEKVSFLSDGIDMIVPYYSQYLPQLISAIIIPIIICISAAVFDRFTALIMVITYPLIPIFMILIGYKSKEISEKQWKKLNILSSHFLDMLQGIKTLKIFGKDKVQEKKVYEISEEYRNTTMEVLRITFLSALVLELSSTISTAIIAVNLGIRLIYGKIYFLNAFFILILTPDFYLPLRQLGLKFHSSLNAQVAIERIEAIEKDFDLNKINNSSDKKYFDSDVLEIEAKNLCFKYGEKDALYDVNFKIKKGEKIALVGESGSGKSTLISILAGLLKAGGDMLFINGEDINNINIKSYLKDIAIVPQFPHIFNATIEENVFLGTCDRNSSFYETAMLSKFAEQYENSYKTIIGAGEKVEISGGEKQRISFARAALKDAKLVILDEPTSSLDPETEAFFTDAVKKLFIDKTVIIAAHRLNTIINSDRILVLNKGKIVESGTYDILIQNKGFFYKMLYDRDGIYEDY